MNGHYPGREHRSGDEKHEHPCGQTQSTLDEALERLSRLHLANGGDTQAEREVMRQLGLDPDDVETFLEQEAHYFDDLGPVAVTVAQRYFDFGGWLIMIGVEHERSRRARA
jgi:hypothetical protein